MQLSALLYPSLPDHLRNDKSRFIFLQKVELDGAPHTAWPVDWDDVCHLAVASVMTEPGQGKARPDVERRIKGQCESQATAQLPEVS